MEARLHVHGAVVFAAPCHPFPAERRRRRNGPYDPRVPLGAAGLPSPQGTVFALLMTVTIYYHLGVPGLSSKSVLEPGDFGRALLDSNPLLLREAVLEAVRTIEFRDRPSRLHCVFGLPSLDDAHSLGVATDAPAGAPLYEIEVADTTPIHQGCMGWLAEVGCEAAEVGQWVGSARAYWSGTAHPTRAWELVIGGPVRVVRQLSARRARY